MDSIIPAAAQGIAKYDDSLFQDMTKMGDWLPRVQLMTSSTKLAKANKIATNNYALILQKDSFIDLGKEIEVIACTWRPCAMRTGGDDLLAVHDPNDPEFKKIQAESEIQDSGCFWGPQFLLYIPGQKRFATFLFGGVSSRPEGANLKPLIGKMAKMSSRFIEGKKHSWQNPTVFASQLEPSDVPDPEKLMAEIEKFNNPPKKTREKAEPTVAAGREQ